MKNADGYLVAFSHAVLSLENGQAEEFQKDEVATSKDSRQRGLGNGGLDFSRLKKLGKR